MRIKSGIGRRFRLSEVWKKSCFRQRYLDGRGSCWIIFVKLTSLRRRPAAPQTGCRSTAPATRIVTPDRQTCRRPECRERSPRCRARSRARRRRIERAASWTAGGIMHENALHGSCLLLCIEYGLPLNAQIFRQAQTAEPTTPPQTQPAPEVVPPAQPPVPPGPQGPVPAQTRRRSQPTEHTLLPPPLVPSGEWFRLFQSRGFGRDHPHPCSAPEAYLHNRS